MQNHSLGRPLDRGRAEQACMTSVLVMRSPIAHLLRQLIRVACKSTAITEQILALLPLAFALG